MDNTIHKLLDIAKTEVGYLEKKSNKDLDSKTANAGSGNYTKYWRDLKPSYQGQAWCNCFVNWCFVKAFGESVAKKLLCTSGEWSYYTPTSAQYFKDSKRWHSTPQVGDIIYFKNTSRIHHVGIVYKVGPNIVYTIEGNTSNGSAVIANGGTVCEKSYAYANNTSIAGYGRPDYSIADITAKNGWVQENGKWFYYSDSGIKEKKKWIKTNHHWYRVGNDGAMLVGWHQIYDEKGRLSWCYFDETEENLGAEWHERSDGVGYLELWTTKD